MFIFLSPRLQWSSAAWLIIQKKIFSFLFIPWFAASVLCWEAGRTPGSGCEVSASLCDVTEAWFPQQCVLVHSGGSRLEALPDLEQVWPSENITARKQRVPVAQISARWLCRFKREFFPPTHKHPEQSDLRWVPSDTITTSYSKENKASSLWVRLLHGFPDNKKTRNSSSSDFRWAVTGLHNFADLKSFVGMLCFNSAAVFVCCSL